MSMTCSPSPNCSSFGSYPALLDCVGFVSAGAESASVKQKLDGLFSR